METTNDSTFESRARGCILGALCGDAIGGVLEHQPIPNDSQIKNAFCLPGGGCHKLGRGQITDDGELTLCLLQALAECSSVLNMNKIASYYGKWVDSRPFDIGGTTRKSLPKAVNMNEHQAEMVRRGAKGAADSQSNGCLMRMSPICVWSCKLSKQDLLKAVREESILTHQNQVTVVIHGAYALAIQHVLNNKGENEAAYKKALEWIVESGNKDANEWIECVEKEDLPAANRNGGWAKIAFCYAMYYLKKNFHYSDALKDILRRGGDTDTNCAIIGAVIGALHGAQDIPEDIKKQVLAFDPTTDKGVKRPKFLGPKYVFETNLEKLIKSIPTELKIIGGTEDYPEKEKKDQKK